MDLPTTTDIGPVRIRQTRGDHTHGVRIQPLPADTLPRIARALAAAGLLDEFAILGRNHGPRGDYALGVLTDSGWFIDWDSVLGIDLTPTDAEQVAAAIDDAANEPPQCDLRIECGGDWATVEVSPTRAVCDACAQHQAEVA